MGFKLQNFSGLLGASLKLDPRTTKTNMEYLGPLCTKKEKTEVSSSQKDIKHTAARIRRSLPTRLLISRSEAYLWLSGREAEFSTVCGRIWKS